MTEYQMLRDDLADLQHRFEKKALPLVPLYHDLIWSPELAGWTMEEYIAFKTANAGRQHFATEEWELWPKGIACSRYYGNAAALPTRLVDFRNLAARAYRVLCGFVALNQHGYSVPDGFRVNVSCLSEERPDEPGAAAHFGWLELLSDSGLYSPTTLLQADNGWWRYQGIPNQTDIDPIIQHRTSPARGPAFHTHPAFISLQIDLAEASAEFIRYCLEPESVLPVGNGLFPIYLPEEPETPFWSNEAGELCFRDRLIKKFTKSAPQQRRLLTAFEQADWSKEIENPFREQGISAYFTDELLQRTVGDLNKTLPRTGLRFGWRFGGMFVTWTAT